MKSSFQYSLNLSCLVSASLDIKINFGQLDSNGDDMLVGIEGKF